MQLPGRVNNWTSYQKFNFHELKLLLWRDTLMKTLWPTGTTSFNRSPIFTISFSLAKLGRSTPLAVVDDSRPI